MFFLKELPTRAMLERFADLHPEMDVAKTSAALHMLRQASLLIRKLDAYFGGHGLSQTRFLILIVLEREPHLDHLTISDLVSRLDVSKPVITNTVKALAADRLIHVSDCKRDGRAKRVAITSRGSEKLRAILPGYYLLINHEMEDQDD